MKTRIEGMMRSIVRLCIAAFLTAAIAAGQDTAYLKWTAKDARRVLSDSPWARPTNLTEHVTDTYRGGESGASMGNPRETVDGPRGYGMARDSGINGEKEVHYAYVARLFSALPIRQAHVRLAQLRAGYDRMSEDQKRSFDDRQGALLKADMKDVIVVSVEFSTNDPNLRVEISQRLRQATRDLLQQSAYLITDRKGRIPLQAYLPPDAEDLGARLVFPRNVGGEPVVLPRDNEIRLEFFVPGAGQKVYVTWKVKDLTRNGTLLF
jgi:hypothetical protein